MAESRTIRTILELDSSRFTAGASRASASASALAKDMAALGGSQSKLKGEYDRAGNTFLGFGTAVVGGLGLATKAAMDWESAWAGVTKTVDGNAQQMGALEEQLRGLAKTLPASHQEIAAVAEAAGQLGVQRENIVGFTRTMIDLGETTNLSADEAATAIAQFSNVMHVSADDVDNFGSALVDLGNKGASTEADILAMSQRLSGTGALIGASAQDILGLSSALADVGISAEAGGGSISRVLQKMNTAVLDSGDKLDGFAEVAGVSAEEFAAKWRESPIQAMQLFEKGLQGVTDNGGNAVQTLRDLGIQSSEETRAVLALASNYEGLGTSLDTANTAWEQNTALVAEAAKRYETTESKIRMAGNTMKDAAIDLGGAILPVLASAAEGAAGLAEGFGNLPAPVQSAVAQLGLIAGAASLGVGGLMKLIPAVSDTIGAFRTLSEESPKLAGALGKTTKVLGNLTIAAVGVSALTALGDSMRDYTLGANEATQATLNLSKSASPMNDVFAGMFPPDAPLQANEMADGLDRLANGSWWGGLQDAGTNILNIFGDFGPTFEDQRARLEQFGEQLGGLAQTDLPRAQEAFTALWQEAGGTAEAGQNLLTTMPALRDTLIGVAAEMGVATDDATLLKIATGEISPAAEGAASSLGIAAQAMEDTAGQASDAIDNITKLGGAFLDARGAARDYADALEEAKDGSAGKHWEDGTKAARENAEAIDDLSRSALDNIQAMRDNGEQTSGFMQQARNDIIAQAEAFGATKEEAEAYADALGLTPATITTQVQLEDTEAQRRIAAYQAMYDSIPPKVLTEVGVDSELGRLEFDYMSMRATEWDSSTVTATLDLDTSAGRAALGDLETAIMNADGTVTINGETASGEQALAELKAQIDGSNGTVTINGTSVPADQALDALIGQVNSGSGTITIKGNSGPADQATNSAVWKANASSGTIKVGANTGAANAQIDTAARDRYATIHVNTVVSGAGNVLRAALGRADGGWLAPGKSSGGWVPGPYPGAGVDNVLWPLAPGAAGGRYLAQPLAGNEFVVNGRQSRVWGPVLEAINAGAMPRTSVGGSSPQVTNHFHEVGGEAAEIAARRVLNDVVRSVRSIP